MAPIAFRKEDQSLEIVTASAVASAKEARPNIQPVQVLAPESSSSTRFVLNEEALKSVLCDPRVADKKVVVISVAGAFRKGKSFLLNFFLEYLYNLSETKAPQETAEHDWLCDEKQLCGFHWRAGAHRDTSGMWMWGEAVLVRLENGEKVAVVLVDTQGAFDTASTVRQCTTIFALSTMISSVQIYNIVDTIQEDNLQNLSLFVEYGKLAMREGGNSQSTPFQTLVFLVRDFKAPDDYAFGKEGGSALLNDALKVIENQQSELKDVRELIKECFKNISCYLLPHPGFTVSERTSFNGCVEDIRATFKDEIKKFVPDLLHVSKLEPKEIAGKAITCKKLVDCFREYARTFDSDSLPNPKNILEANAQLLCMDAVDDAIAIYRNGMDKACSGRRMISNKHLEEMHQKYTNLAIMQYSQYPKIGSDEVCQRNLTALHTSINNEYERYRRANDAKRMKSGLFAAANAAWVGVGLGTAAVVSTTGAVIAVDAGVISVGIVALPVAAAACFIVWAAFRLRPRSQYSASAATLDVSQV